MRTKLILGVLAAVAIVGVVAIAATDERGNGLPKGKSFNFNVIAVPNEKENWDDGSGGEGNRIFILRGGKTEFYVHGADDTFAIVDHDGTDGKVGSAAGLAGAGIILPYDTETGTWDCTVYVRLLGPAQDAPHLQWTTSVWEDGVWAQVSSFRLDRSTKFAVPTGAILVDGYQDILWSWDAKHNLRICQFRIFVGAPEGGYPDPR